MPSKKISKFDDKLSSDMVVGKIIIPSNSDNSSKNIPPRNSELGSTPINNGAINDGSSRVKHLDLKEFFKNTCAGQQNENNSNSEENKEDEL